MLRGMWTSCLVQDAYVRHRKFVVLPNNLRCESGDIETENESERVSVWDVATIHKGLTVRHKKRVRSNGNT